MTALVNRLNKIYEKVYEKVFQTLGFTQASEGGKNNIMKKNQVV